MKMKNLFIIFFLFFNNYIFSQTLIIHKNDGERKEYQLSQIDSITFSILATLDTVGLLIFYPFDGNLDDSTGHGFNGTNYGAIFNEDKYFRPGRALYFAGGSSSYVTTSNTNLLSLNDAFSICFWIKFQQAGVIVERDIVGTENTDWNIRCNEDGKVGFEFGSSTSVWSNQSIKDINWHLVAISREKSSGEIKIFIDGNLDQLASGYFIDLIGDAYLNLGAWDTPYGFQDGFSGMLDQVRIYSKVLNDAEIQYLWNNY